MTIRSRTWQPAAALASLAALAGGAPAAVAATPAYLNTSLPPQIRAADLVHRMTLPEKVSQLVNGARAIPRLGVPAYNWWSEALHGVAVDGTTEFPEPIGLAATFDVPGIHEMAHDIGVEAKCQLLLDADVVAWFKSHTRSNEGYQTRINRALREYVQGQTSRSRRSRV